MKKFSAATGILCCFLIAGSAQAAVLFSFEETGGDVVGTLSGSLDLEGATPFGPSPIPLDVIRPNAGFVSVSGGAGARYAILGPAIFGTGSAVFGVGDGDAFSVNGGFQAISVPDGYGGGQLNSTLTFAGTTLALLGITPGEYVYSLPNDTVTLRFNAAVIPLPATLPLLLGALGLGLAALRRRG